MKKSLVIAVALMLVLAFATSAMAAQVFENGQYKATPTGAANKVGDSNVTEYPYKIYLPNAMTPGDYRIHSNYAKNTDACASCHSTHTAVGNNLLQWYTTYETCMACHDGTVTTTYDVASGKIGTGAPAMGGAFGTTDGSDSNHNVVGALSIAAAPGGTTVAEEFTVGGKTQNRWSPTFGCESCHTPHGNGGNARILHPDANYTATKAAAAVTTGYTIQAVTNIVYNGSNPVYILKGYPYAVSITDNAGVVTAAYLDNSAGYSVVENVGTATRVYGTPSLKVTMNIADYLEQTETVEHVSGMNAFCGACHTDYNTQGISTPSDKLTGTYTQAHRHAVGVAPTYNNAVNLGDAGMVLESDTLECLTCHVAHGVNEDYWVRTVGSTGNAYMDDAQLVELAGSSALKRLPNMGTCEACHQKGASAEGYTANSGSATAGTGAVSEVALANEFYIGDDATTLGPNGDGLDWVGAAKCAVCHKEKFDNWKLTKHYTNTRASNFSAATGCSYTRGDDEELNYGSEPINTTVGSLGFGLPASYSQAGSANFISCHAVGTWAMGNPTKASGSSFYYVSASDRGLDSAVTCEACHGSGAKHIQAPTTKNIINPMKSAANFEAKVLFCAKCHEKTRNVSAADVNANDMFTGDTAGGGSEYAQSGHYTAQAASCDTCHDVHQKRGVQENGDGTVTEDETPEALKLPYKQLCASCHDVIITPITQTMGKASDRHLSNHAFADGFAGKTAVASTVTSAAYTTEAAANGSQDRTASITVVVYEDAGKTIPITTTSYLGTYSLVAPAGASTANYTFTTSSGSLKFLKNKAQTPGDYVVNYSNIKTPSVTATITHVVTP